MAYILRFDEVLGSPNDSVPMYAVSASYLKTKPPSANACSLEPNLSVMTLLQQLASGAVQRVSKA